MIRRSTGILLGTFLVLVIFAIAFQRDRADQEAQATPLPTPQRLLEEQVAEVATLQIVDAEGQTAELLRHGDEWRLQGYPSGQTDQDEVTSILAQLNSLNVLRNLEGGSDLAAIGLDPPAYTVTVRWDDDREQVVYVGDQTPTQDGYYALVQGGSPLVVNGFGMDLILDTLREPPLLPTPTTIVPETPSPQP